MKTKKGNSGPEEGWRWAMGQDHTKMGVRMELHAYRGNLFVEFSFGTGNQ